MNALDKYDVYFGIEGYTKQLRETTINVKSSSENQAVLLNKFRELVKFEDNNENFKKIICDTFAQIAEVFPGKNLLNRFISKQISLTIRPDAKTKTKNEIICDTTRARYYFSIDDEGKVILIEQTLSTYLFRKMIHLCQDLMHKEFSKTALFSSEPIENGFLFAKNLPLRISNLKGPKIPSKKNLSFIDTFLSLEKLNLERSKEYILEKKHLIQKKEICFFSLDEKHQIYGKKVFPITAACYFGAYELVFHLIEFGASLFVKDELGGPLQACFWGGDFILAKKLCEQFDLCKEEDLLESLIHWLAIDETELESLFGIESFLEILEPHEKCELFHSLLLKERPFKFLAYLILSLAPKSRILKKIDPKIDGLLKNYIKFLISPREIPLDYEYARLFVELANTIPFTKSALDAAIFSEEIENRWILNLLNKKFLGHSIDIELLDKLDFENIFSKTHLA